jgi:hypothetical protein
MIRKDESFTNVRIFPSVQNLLRVYPLIRSQVDKTRILTRPDPHKAIQVFYKILGVV